MPRRVASILSELDATAQGAEDAGYGIAQVTQGVGKPSYPEQEMPEPASSTGAAGTTDAPIVLQLASALDPEGAAIAQGIKSI